MPWCNHFATAGIYTVLLSTSGYNVQLDGKRNNNNKKASYTLMTLK